MCGAHQHTMPSARGALSCPDLERLDGAIGGVFYAQRKSANSYGTWLHDVGYRLAGPSKHKKRRIVC